MSNTNFWAIRIALRPFSVYILGALLGPLLVYADAQLIGHATSTQVETFRDRSAAHRLRLSETMMQLLQDQAFLAKFPEFKPLAKDLARVMKVTVFHDFHKNALPDGHSVIQTLASAEGMDSSSLHANDPNRSLIIQNVQSLNKLDDELWDKLLKENFKDPKSRQLMNELIKTIDWHDTAQTRRPEFESEKNKLKRPWLTAREFVILQAEAKKISETEKLKMIQFAEYLEGPFAEKYKAIATRFSSQNVKAAELQNLFAQMLSHADTRSSLKTVAKQTGKATVKVTGGLAAVPIGVGVVKYFIDPQKFDAKSDIGEAFMYLGNMQDCESVECHKFHSQCEADIKSKKYQNIDGCIMAFLNQPLEVQTKARENPEFNRFLRFTSPFIDNLRCETIENELKIDATIEDYDKKKQKLSVNISAKKEIEKISIQNRSPAHELKDKDTQIFYSNDRADTLRFADYRPRNGVFGVYTALTPNEWLNKKIYFWSGHTPAGKEAVLQAQQAHRLMNVQKEVMLSCCQRPACTNYFQDRERMQKQQRPPPAGARIK